MMEGADDQRGERAMSGYTVISADCHGGATYALGGFLEYVDPQYRGALRDEMARLEKEAAERMARLFAGD